jgi:hypothetical protein
MSRQPPEELVCPSGRCQPGSQLIGIVGPDGRLGYVTPPMEIDSDFVAAAHRGRAPEARFRFTEPCLGQRCQHWANSQCALIDAICTDADVQLAVADESQLPRCGIRSRCRWFSQRGLEACHVCPIVVRVPRLPRSDPEASHEAAG